MVDSLWALFLWRFQKHTDRSDRVHWTILPLRFFSAFLRRPSWFFFLSLEKRKTDLPAEFTQYIGCSSNGKNIGVSWRFWIKTRPLFGTHPFWWTKPDFSKRRFRFQNSPFFLFRLLRTIGFSSGFFCLNESSLSSHIWKRIKYSSLNTRKQRQIVFPLLSTRIRAKTRGKF